MVQVKVLSTYGDFLKFSPLTFPCLHGRQFDQDHFLGIGYEGDRPLAYILAYLSKTAKQADLLSIFVHPEYRNRGYGISLIDRLEIELLSKGVTSISTLFSDEAVGLKPFLERCSWQIFPGQTTCKVGAGGLQAPWVHHDYRLPTSYKIVPWAEVSSAQKEELWHSNSLEPWIPPEVLPWKHDVCWHPSTSFGLLQESSIAGWLITHQLKPELLRYSCAFCRPDLHKKALMVPLIAKAICQQSRETTDPHAIWTIYPEQQQMLNFVKRHIVPFGASMIAGYESRKNLLQEQ
jgi:GNAT superfamily N-acetyltransferase